MEGEEGLEDELVDDIIDSKDMNLSKLKIWEIEKTGKPGILQSMGSQTVGYN